jgi:phytoene/squalene synthetase
MDGKERKMQQPIDAGIITEVRSRDYRRFLAIQRAPAAKRPALYAITAFYNELAHISESVSDPMLAAIRFSWWREGIESIVKGEAPRAHPVMSAIAFLLAQDLVAPETLYTMIQERDVDIDASLLTDEPRFLSYLDATAGTLCLLWARILGGNTNSDTILVLARGCAMIGLIRAIPHYASKDKLRFPKSMIEAHGLEFAASALAYPSDKVQMLSHYVHGKAMVSLTLAANARSALPAPHRVLLSFALKDANTLSAIAYDPYHPRLTTTPLLQLVWRALRA